MGALRYKSEFQSLAGRRYIVNIWDDEHEGSVREFCLGPEGFELSYEGSTEDMFKAFIPSRLEFTFNVEDTIADTFIYQVATAKPSRFKIYVTDGPASGDGSENLFWQGFIQGEGISIADDYYPYEVKLAAGDIGFFKDVEFKKSGGPASGYFTAVELLQDALQYTGHNDFYGGLVHNFDEILETSMEWRAVGMASAGDPLELVQIDGKTFFSQVDTNTYTYKNCQHVVDNVARLFGARFFQSAGKFRLAQIDNLVESAQDIYTYTIGTPVGSGTRDARKTINRIELFETAGGAWSFIPGLKYAEREYVFGRNWMQGVKCDQDNPLSFVIGDIPILNYLFISGQPPRFTLKFNITYQIVKVPDRSLIEDAITSWSWKDGYIDMVPLWEMQLYGTGKTSGDKYYFSQAMSKQPNVGLTVASFPYYKERVDTKNTWKFSYTKPDWRLYVLDDPIAEAERIDKVNDVVKFFDIIDENEYRVNVWPPDGMFNTDGTPTSKYVPESRTVSVELAIPSFGGNIGEDVEDLTIELNIQDIYNRWFRQWASQGPAKDLADYIEWSVDSFEFYVHGATIEEQPETARKYRVTSPDGYRRTEELPQNELLSLDKRTWHHVRVDSGGGVMIDPVGWQRGAEEEQQLNYLSVQQAVAMNRAGLRLYQGGLIDKSGQIPHYHNTLVKGSLRYMILQGTVVARFDEWRTLQMVHLERDISGLTYEEIKSGSAPASSNSLPGGNYSTNNNPSTGEPSGGALKIPIYEFASGQTGSTYSLIEIDLSGASAFDNGSINQNLMVFQDATKLNYPLGYTIDFATNELTFTYPLEDAVLELYYYG